VRTWRVTSPSGMSTVGNTVVVPTIKAPAHVVSGALAVIGGRATPGQRLTLYRRTSDAATWAVAVRLTVANDGTWSVRRHPRHSFSYQAVANGQHSRTVSVTVE